MRKAPKAAPRPEARLRSEHHERMPGVPWRDHTCGFWNGRVTRCASRHFPAAAVLLGLGLLRWNADARTLDDDAGIAEPERRDYR